MPIQGKFYTSKELQILLGVSRQRISNLSREQNFLTLSPGLYCAKDVEPYLEGRNIDPLTLPIYDQEYPEGATLAQRNVDFIAAYDAAEE